MNNDLFQHSIELILNNQHSSGAYLASPNFDTYKYCWFRDGSFTAYAMDLVGEHSSASRFHHWAAQVVNKRAELIKIAIEKSNRGEPLAPNDILNTRYLQDGSEDAGDWPNFQLDGLGTWLWALAEHQKLSAKQLPPEICQAASQTENYLTALWRRPCYDCWEEFPDQIHLYTLSAIWAGLKANYITNSSENSKVLEQIKVLIYGEGTHLSYFPKFVGTDMVDASLIGLAVPYRIVDPDHPIMMSTIAKIESDLQSGGGLHRYIDDTYYGGGEWILLTAWLAWYYVQIGRSGKAERLLKWVEAQADRLWELPEQIPASLNDPRQYTPWIKRWGEIAKPLLWSHAKYLILIHAIRSQKGK